MVNIPGPELPSIQDVREQLIPTLWDIVPFVSDFFDIPEYDPFDEHRFRIHRHDMTCHILYNRYTGDNHPLNAELLSQPINEIIDHIRCHKINNAS